MEFLASHHGYPLGSQHPCVTVSTLGEWFSGSCHPTFSIALGWYIHIFQHSASFALHQNQVPQSYQVISTTDLQYLYWTTLSRKHRFVTQLHSAADSTRTENRPVAHPHQLFSPINTCTLWHHVLSIYSPIYCCERNTSCRENIQNMYMNSEISISISFIIAHIFHRTWFWFLEFLKSTDFQVELQDSCGSFEPISDRVTSAVGNDSDSPRLVGFLPKCLFFCWIYKTEAWNFCTDGRMIKLRVVCNYRSRH